MALAPPSPLTASSLDAVAGLQVSFLDLVIFFVDFAGSLAKVFPTCGMGRHFCKDLCRFFCLVCLVYRQIRCFLINNFVFIYKSMSFDHIFNYFQFSLVEMNTQKFNAILTNAEKN